MKHIIAAVLLLTASGAWAQSALDRGVLDEMNLARTDPLRYAEIVKGERSHYRGKMLTIDTRKIATREGVEALDEAVKFLRKQKPLPPLTLSEGLRQAATDHVNTQGPTQATGHAGSDGKGPADRAAKYGRWEQALAENLSYGFSNPRQVVIQLIVDDGVPDRGHRKNIFNRFFRVAGVACGPHAGYGSMCVIDFAANFAEASGAKR